MGSLKTTSLPRPLARATSSSRTRNRSAPSTLSAGTLPDLEQSTVNLQTSQSWFASPFGRTTGSRAPARSFARSTNTNNWTTLSTAKPLPSGSPSSPTSPSTPTSSTDTELLSPRLDPSPIGQPSFRLSSSDSRTSQPQDGFSSLSLSEWTTSSSSTPSSTPPPSTTSAPPSRTPNAGSHSLPPQTSTPSDPRIAPRIYLQQSPEWVLYLLNYLQDDLPDVHANAKTPHAGLFASYVYGVLRDFRWRCYAELDKQNEVAFATSKDDYERSGLLWPAPGGGRGIYAAPFAFGEDTISDIIFLMRTRYQDDPGCQGFWRLINDPEGSGLEPPPPPYRDPRGPDTPAFIGAIRSSSSPSDTVDLRGAIPIPHRVVRTHFSRLTPPARGAPTIIQGHANLQPANFLPDSGAEYDIVSDEFVRLHRIDTIRAPQPLFGAAYDGLTDQ